MSLVGSRLSLIHRCNVSRNLNLGTDDGWGNPLPPDWEEILTDVQCRGWVAGKEVVANKSVLTVVLDVRLIVSLGTDVTEGDQIDKITFRDGTVQDGPLAVRAVLGRRVHVELILGKAV